MKGRLPFGTFWLICSVTWLTLIGVCLRSLYHSDRHDAGEGSNGPRIFEVQGVLMLSANHDALSPSDMDATISHTETIERGDAGDDLMSKSVRDCAPANNVKRFTTVLDAMRRASMKRILSVVITLHNSARIIPALTRTLTEALTMLQSTHHVYVSVYDDGSEDDTSTALGEMARKLRNMDLQGVWIISSLLKSDFERDHRALVLSEIRNAALRPILPFAGNGSIVFMNDIITCPSDLLELVLLRDHLNADAITASDWDILFGANALKMYDLWVHRSDNDTVYPHPDDSCWPTEPNTSVTWSQHVFSSLNPELYESWLTGRPMPMYASWGGMVAMDASLFTRQGLRFRSSASTGWINTSSNETGWSRLLEDPRYTANDCPGASECELLMRDTWALRNGSAKIALSPQSNTCYTLDDQQRVLAELPITSRMHLPLNENDLIDWSSTKAPQEVLCIPSISKTGHAISRESLFLQSGYRLPTFFNNRYP